MSDKKMMHPVSLANAALLARVSVSHFERTYVRPQGIEVAGYPVPQDELNAFLAPYMPGRHEHMRDRETWLKTMLESDGPLALPDAQRKAAEALPILLAGDPEDAVDAWGILAIRLAQAFTAAIPEDSPEHDDWPGMLRTMIGDLSKYVTTLRRERKG